MKNLVNNNLREVGFQMKKSALFAFAFVLLLTSFAFAESFYGNVVEVIDGNNIVVSHDSRQSVIRFEGVDCPELSQDFGLQAQEFVSGMVLGRRVWVDVIRKDYHSRLMSFVKIEDKNVSKELINAGLAWYCSKFQKYPDIAAAESSARSIKIGIWTAENPTSPQAFRRESLGIRPNHVPGKVQIGGNSGGYGFSPQYSGFAFNSQPKEYGQSSSNKGFAYSNLPREYGQSSSNRGFAYSSLPREYGQSSSNRGFAYSTQPGDYGCKTRSNFGYGIKDASWPTGGFRSVVSGGPGSSSGPGASSPGVRGPGTGSPYTPSR
ncbi:MAG: thermonuclease family protein [Candidatus Xenobiia bacterium LiM19]